MQKYIKLKAAIEAIATETDRYSAAVRELTSQIPIAETEEVHQERAARDLLRRLSLQKNRHYLECKNIIGETIRRGRLEQGYYLAGTAGLLLTVFTDQRLRWYARNDDGTWEKTTLRKIRTLFRVAGLSARKPAAPGLSEIDAVEFYFSIYSIELTKYADAAIAAGDRLSIFDIQKMCSTSFQGRCSFNAAWRREFGEINQEKAS